MKILKWLYPGMFVKRWMLLTTLGVILIAMGFVVGIVEPSGQNKTAVGIVIIIGIIFVITGISRIIKSIVVVLSPQKLTGELVEKVYQKRILERGPNIVAIGGGTGLSTLLHGLKEYTSNIAAIVTVADDGGSSGRLREELDVLPPGDIRNCLVALADAEPLMGKLFQFRFNEGESLKGHNFGNLFITALSKVAGDFEKAIKESSKILAIRGSVIPSTLEKVVLIAKHKDGSETVGESKLAKTQSPVQRLYLRPSDCKPTNEAIEAIRKTSAIVLGPGSLYTSVMPNLLIGSIFREIARSRAIKIYVCNVMTEEGETDNYTVSDHIRSIIEHTRKGIIDICIVNTARVPGNLLAKYKEENAYPVVVDEENVKKLGCHLIKANVISTENYVRHDPNKLAKIINNLIGSIKKR